MSLPLIINSYSAVITAGQSLSAGVPIGADTLAGLVVPSGWVAASITFQVSIDNGATWNELYDDAGVAVTLTNPPAGAAVTLASHPSYMWRPWNYIKVRSGTSGSPVVQTGGATVTLIGRPEIF